MTAVALTGGAIGCAFCERPVNNDNFSKPALLRRLSRASIIWLIFKTFENITDHLISVKQFFPAWTEKNADPFFFKTTS
jgi:hypothetical protein